MKTQKQKALTTGEAIVLVMIRDLIAERGQIPTAQEVAVALNMAAEKNGREKVCSYIRQLQKKGYLSTSKERVRNIKVL